VLIAVPFAFCSQSGLLPIAMVAVACVSAVGAALARGLINDGSNDFRRIGRRASQEIEGRLGYVDEPEIVHRDNLILS